jgi:hypothetical protein
VRLVKPSDSQLEDNLSGGKSNESDITAYIADDGGTDSNDNIDDSVNTCSEDDTSYFDSTSDDSVDSSSSTSSKVNSYSSTGTGLIKDHLGYAKRRRARKLFGCKKEHPHGKH